MKILLAAQGFKNNDSEYNQRKIISTIKNYSNSIDLIVFGESFLQGFDALTWNFEIDRKIAVTQNDNLIMKICSAAKENNVGVSFGYFELFEDFIYSSQIVISKNGEIIYNYRRISTGWKIKETDDHYKEGKSFDTFTFCEKRISIALCGDLWHENNIKSINQLNKDIILWPVYTDYNFIKWNENEKFEYAKQASKSNSKVLYVNSCCMDKNEDEIARGGAAYFANGEIVNEVPSGEENFLLLDL